MSNWKNARTDVLARLAEVRKCIEAHDESGAIALINQQDAFCDAAKERAGVLPMASSATECAYCEGYRQAGGCQGILDQIDRAILHAEWDHAAKLIDEYSDWVGKLDVGAGN